MKFSEEPGGYNKTALSDLQGAWETLREAALLKFEWVKGHEH
jgi:hypothetical protein